MLMHQVIDEMMMFTKNPLTGLCCRKSFVYLIIFIDSVMRVIYTIYKLSIRNCNILFFVFQVLCWILKMMAV